VRPIYQLLLDDVPFTIAVEHSKPSENQYTLDPQINDDTGTKVPFSGSRISNQQGFKCYWTIMVANDALLRTELSALAENLRQI